MPLGPSRTRWITMGFRENTMGPRWCPLAARQGGVNLAAARLAGPVARRPAGVPAGLLAGPVTATGAPPGSPWGCPGV